VNGFICSMVTFGWPGRVSEPARSSRRRSHDDGPIAQHREDELVARRETKPVPNLPGHCHLADRRDARYLVRAESPPRGCGGLRLNCALGASPLECIFPLRMRAAPSLISFLVRAPRTTSKNESDEVRTSNQKTADTKRRLQKRIGEKMTLKMRVRIGTTNSPIRSFQTGSGLFSK
jgi:hypothetical protein